MAQCPSCKGSGICKPCDGTGSGKKVNPHPKPSRIDDRGNSKCPGCDGSGKCSRCDGSGRI